MENDRAVRIADFARRQPESDVRVRGLSCLGVTPLDPHCFGPFLSQFVTSAAQRKTRFEYKPPKASLRRGKSKLLPRFRPRIPVLSDTDRI
jgi:hypothetical protein